MLKPPFVVSISEGIIYTTNDASHGVAKPTKDMALKHPEKTEHPIYASKMYENRVNRLNRPQEKTQRKNPHRELSDLKRKWLLRSIED